MQAFSSLIPVYGEVVCCVINRAVYRDIGGSDPERMAAPKVAEYVEQQFKDTCVQVSMFCKNIENVS